MRAPLLLVLLTAGCDGGIKGPPVDTDTEDSGLPGSCFEASVESVDFGAVG